MDDVRTRFSDRVGISTSDTQSSTSTVVDAAGNGDRIVNKSITSRISRRASVTADISVPSFQINPVTTSWELVKFSFIIDWFVDIGTWLEAMSFVAVSENYSASHGFRLDVTKYIVEDTTFINQYYGNYHSESYAEASLKSRTPTTVSQSPQTGINLDTPKIFDILALLEKSIASSFSRLRI
jgi:hypothetical protein